MGANFDRITFKSKLIHKELQKAFGDYQEECAYESGHSYSGRLNMCRGLEISNMTFNDEEQALDYITNNYI